MNFSENSAAKPLTAARAAVRETLERYLAETIPGADAVVVTLSDEASKAGFSAETIIFDAAYSINGQGVERPLVLRRLIPGQEVTFDASLVTQARTMDALRTRTSLPVPGIIGVGEAEHPFGAPFLIMERLPGRIVPQMPNYNLDGWLASLALSERAAVWERGIRAVAAVNRIDWREGLEFLDQPQRGAPGLEQHLSWVEEWLGWVLGARSHPVAETAMAFLKANAPLDAPVDLLWGDAIPANLLFDGDNEVSGIIDWEFVCLGPGECDLAWWLYFDRLFSDGFNVPRLAGLPDRDTMISVYEKALGRPISNLPYYEILCGLRMVIASMRSVARVVEAGKISPDSDAWLNNPSSAWVARQLGLDPVVIGPDFGEFVGQLFERH